MAITDSTVLADINGQLTLHKYCPKVIGKKSSYFVLDNKVSGTTKTKNLIAK